MSERFTYSPSSQFALSADSEKRTIRGLAVPTDATVNRFGKTYRFPHESVQFGERTPILKHHEDGSPVGKLVASKWTEQGLEVELKISNTRDGDDMLQLALDDVLGLSVALDDWTETKVGEEIHFADAHAYELSLTPLPALAGAAVSSVSLSQEGVTKMTETNTVADVTAAIAEGFKNVQLSGPTPQPVPVAQVREEAPYRFNGTSGAHGFVEDFRLSHAGDSGAKQRLMTYLRQTFAAVDSGDIAPIQAPQFRPDMAVTPVVETRRPLYSAITSGSLADGRPFSFPRWSITSPTVGVHTENVEPPVTGSITADNQTITPTALSSKAEITREAWLNSNPQIDQLVFAEMNRSAQQGREAAVLEMLDALTLTAIPLTGADDVLVDGLTDELIDLQYEVGGERFTSLIAARDLFRGLVQAKDSSGRKLLPVIGPQNANGTVNAAFTQVNIGSTTAVPAWSLTSTNSYLLVPSSVYSWESAPQELVFDIQVKSVYLGYFQFVASAVTRDTDVKRLTYTA